VDRGQADIIVADLGRELGMPGLALNDEGMGILALDQGAAIVAIGYDKTAGTIDLMTCLAEVEPSPARSLAALRANFSSRGPGCEILAVDPSSGAFVLQRRYGGQDLVEGGLAGAVQGLLTRAEQWTRRLASLAGPGTTYSQPAPSGRGIRA
jgi:hypothetical protein